MRERMRYLGSTRQSATSWVIFSITEDAVSGPYKTIGEAIEAAEPGGMILISQGKYMESLAIT